MTQEHGSASTPERAGALRGLRVINFGHYIAGPLAGMLLADQGAEVIKVEKPQGDPARVHGAVQGDGTAHLRRGARRRR